MASSDGGSSSNHGLYLQLAGRMAQRMPVLRAIPVVRLIMAGEVLLMGKHHLDRLTPEERGDLVRLVAKGRGRPKKLTASEQERLGAMIEKLEPRMFLADAADRMSPLGVPSPLRDRLAGVRHGGRGGANGARDGSNPPGPS
ncbi:MAG TPA: hypothetical protein VFN48_09150 [Solirubrobacteraceae bacterium]|nr:hypothetical protein [Solirubrobacteraceae bacterium]